MKASLRAIHYPGIRADSLGGYLSGMGLLAAVARKWPAARGCWRDDHFMLLMDQAVDVEGYLMTAWEAPAYPGHRRFWRDDQMADTKEVAANRPPKRISKLRSSCTESEVEFMDSHVVSRGRNVFNPVFGTGGNIGKRDLAKVAKEASALIAKNTGHSKGWLDWTLYGRPTDLPELPSAGTWFVRVNRTYNSGQPQTKQPFRDSGVISPWSYLLALMGSLLLRGTIGRRLGSGAQAYACFPFVARPASSTSQVEGGQRRSAEFWAPIWDIPATIHEMTALVRRGRARVGAMDATAPHEFALAAQAAGVDRGVKEFYRFELKETTSKQTVEALARPSVPVATEKSAVSTANLLAPLASWVRRLPGDRDVFNGLRGPVERAIIRLSERPDEPELWRRLLLTLAETQSRIDRNLGWRKGARPLPLLDVRWIDRLWPGATRSPEVEIACALASIGGNTRVPLIVNVFGLVIDERGGMRFPTARTQRAVWHEGSVARVLCDVLHRRLVDGQEEKDWPLDASHSITQELVDRFLRAEIDDAEVVRWVPPLSLLRWSARFSSSRPHAVVVPQLSWFFKPLVTSGLRWGRERVEPRPAFALRIVNLLRNGNVDLAVDAAISRYRALGCYPIVPAPPLGVDGDRLAASLLIPVRRGDVLRARNSWTLDVARV